MCWMQQIHWQIRENSKIAHPTTPTPPPPPPFFLLKKHQIFHPIYICQLHLINGLKTTWMYKRTMHSPSIFFLDPYRADAEKKGDKRDWSLSCTFLRLVLTINSRARCWIGAGSSGRRTMLLSRGSPGTIAQWSKTERENACPWVWYLKSVSKPKLSITGRNACSQKAWKKQGL